jgi:adenine-specific DNA-methyltransferase
MRSELPILSHNRADRKAGGIFYTPPPMVDALVEWALKQESRRVLDPSFGDGRFLAAASRRLRHLGVRKPGSHVYGVEVERLNPAAKKAMEAAEIPHENLTCGDFFATDLDHWNGDRFDAIVGNPPYVRHHLLGSESRRLARVHAKRVGIELNDRSDAWAYFCAALLDYLAPEGRLALLLPGAVLHADYALPLLYRLSEARGHVQLVRIKKHLFEDAVEKTIVLLIDGGREEAGVEYVEVADVEALALRLRSPSPPKRSSPIGLAISPAQGSTPEIRLRTRLTWFLDSDIARLWSRVTDLASVNRLGELADIHIGVVTGANKFFVRTMDEIQMLEADSAPVISRGGWLGGSCWTSVDQEGKQGSRSRLLLAPPAAAGNLSKALQAEIALGEGEGLHERVHCRKRIAWYRVEDRSVSDMFIPYMGSSPPRLTINLASALCTNAVHRVYLRPGTVSPAAVAAGSWTSLYRLSAELVGRSYGGGVLKLELGEASMLQLPILMGGGDHLHSIEEVRLSQGSEAAQIHADDLLLEKGLGLSADDTSRLREAATELKHRR